MAPRERRQLALALLVAAVLGALAVGCGTTFKLPNEVRGASGTAQQGTYLRIATWDGMTNIQDILLTPGGELFLVFQDQLAKTGQVRRYPQSNNVPLSTTFPGLLNPTAICSGNNRIFVLDQGDTTAARGDWRTLYPTSPDTACLYTSEYDADVNRNIMTVPGFKRPITNISAYWHVHEYGLDGSPLSSFTDTTFAWVNGVAADASGRVYVSGVIVYGRIDPYNTNVRTLEYRYRIRRYERGSGDTFVVTDLGGSAWRRDQTYVLLDGTGFGYCKDARGMQWAAPQGPALYFADLGNDQAQRYGDPVGGPSSFKLDFGGSGPDSMQLSRPLDVAVDSAGYVYVVDAGDENPRVLRYDSDGRFVQRVDWNVGEVKRPLVRPVAVAADNRQVYIADRGAAQVLRFRRRD
jgi:hypothetical protein